MTNIKLVSYLILSTFFYSSLYAADDNVHPSLPLESLIMWEPISQTEKNQLMERLEAHKEEKAEFLSLADAIKQDDRVEEILNLMNDNYNMNDAYNLQKIHQFVIYYKSKRYYSVEREALRIVLRTIPSSDLDHNVKCMLHELSI